jgi:hypothetical protein
MHQSKRMALSGGHKNVRPSLHISAPDLVLVKSAAGSNTYINMEWRELLGENVKMKVRSETWIHVSNICSAHPVRFLLLVLLKVTHTFVYMLDSCRS